VCRIKKLKSGHGPTRGCRVIIIIIIIIITITIIFLLFMCRVNSQKANYRHSAVFDAGNNIIYKPKLQASTGGRKKNNNNKFH
jgi:flagellar basal body-associated protein FliL